MNYDKPFKTYTEQVNHLIDTHKLNIGDKVFAERVLRFYPYYYLINGYQDIFMKNEVFDDNINFNYLVLFHNFNLEFQNIIIKYCLMVENTYKSNLAYVISEAFGVDVNQYLNVQNFINPMNKKKRKQLKEFLDKIKKEASTTDHLPTFHYRENHNHIPAWILFINLTFGQTIDFLKYLENREKTKLYDLMLPIIRHNPNQNHQTHEALSIVRKFRNNIAHNLKIITYQATKSLSFNDMPDIINHYLLYDRSSHKLNDMFAMMASLTYLLNEPILITNFVDDLRNLFNKYIQRNHQQVILDFCAIANLPHDFIDRFRRLVEGFTV